MLKDRIRKYLPVVLDLETGGLDNKKNPILEIAIQLLEYRGNNFELGELIRYHIEPFKDLEIDPESLEFTKIDLSHPLRNAVEENVALKNISKAINQQRSKYECSRVILVAHNAHFDLGFLPSSVNISEDPDKDDTDLLPCFATLILFDATTSADAVEIFNVL